MIQDWKGGLMKKVQRNRTGHHGKKKRARRHDTDIQDLCRVHWQEPVMSLLTG